MILVERHIIKDNRFEDICLKSGLLYNYVLYLVRQGIFNKEYLKEYDLSTKLGRENQFDFRQLPASVSQQVVGQVFKSVNLWMKQKKDFDKNPGKYNNHRPHLPKYKKGKKQNMVVFTTSSCRIKDDGCIHFAKNVIKPIKTNISKEELKQVRIIPQTTCYVIEVVYERREQDLNICKSNVLSIDLGIDNLCSCISNVGIKPFIINGRIIKSVNQWCNKMKAKFQSFIMSIGKSRKLSWINNYRNNWICDHLHKISRYIVDLCVKNNIGSIVIGYNKGWKNNINIGSVNNQKFVGIPFHNLIDKLSYKSKLLGIDVITHEESHTSKIDHLAFEKMRHQDTYLGKRKKRGLFQSSIGKLLNADINGAIGIGRKVFGDPFVIEVVDRGFAFNPFRISIL